jgi:hypothetical protein
MKYCPWVLGLSLAVWLLTGGTVACAQTAKPGAPPGDQWVSHQMNQPPPDVTDKNALSPEAVDEIEQLYLQAKKELDAKAASAPQAKDQKKDVPQKPVQDAGKK